MKMTYRTGFAQAKHDVLEDIEKFYEGRTYNIEINTIWNSVDVTDGSGNVLYYSDMNAFLEDFDII